MASPDQQESCGCGLQSLGRNWLRRLREKTAKSRRQGSSANPRLTANATSAGSPTVSQPGEDGPQATPPTGANDNNPRADLPQSTVSPPPSFPQCPTSSPRQPSPPPCPTQASVHQHPNPTSRSTPLTYPSTPETPSRSSTNPSLARDQSLLLRSLPVSESDQATVASPRYDQGRLLEGRASLQELLAARDHLFGSLPPLATCLVLSHPALDPVSLRALRAASRATHVTTAGMSTRLLVSRAAALLKLAAPVNPTAPTAPRAQHGAPPSHAPQHPSCLPANAVRITCEGSGGPSVPVAPLATANCSAVHPEITAADAAPASLKGCSTTANSLRPTQSAGVATAGTASPATPALAPMLAVRFAAVAAAAAGSTSTSTSGCKAATAIRRTAAAADSNAATLAEVAAALASQAVAASHAEASVYDTLEGLYYKGTGGNCAAGVRQIVSMEALCAAGLDTAEDGDAQTLLLQEQEATAAGCASSKESHLFSSCATICNPTADGPTSAPDLPAREESMWDQSVGQGRSPGPRETLHPPQRRSRSFSCSGSGGSGSGGSGGGGSGGRATRGSSIAAAATAGAAVATAILDNQPNNGARVLTAFAGSAGGDDAGESSSADSLSLFTTAFSSAMNVQQVEPDRQQQQGQQQLLQQPASGRTQQCWGDRGATAHGGSLADGGARGGAYGGASGWEHVGELDVPVLAARAAHRAGGGGNGGCGGSSSSSSGDSRNRSSSGSSGSGSGSKAPSVVEVEGGAEVPDAAGAAFGLPSGYTCTLELARERAVSSEAEALTAAQAVMQAVMQAVSDREAVSAVEQQTASGPGDAQPPELMLAAMWPGLRELRIALPAEHNCTASSSGSGSSKCPCSSSALRNGAAGSAGPAGHQADTSGGGRSGADRTAAPLLGAFGPETARCVLPPACTPPPSTDPPSGFALRLFLSSGCMLNLKHLRILDLSGCCAAPNTHGRGGRSSYVSGLALDLATWRAMARGLPEGHEVTLRMPLRMLPRLDGAASDRGGSRRGHGSRGHGSSSGSDGGASARASVRQTEAGMGAAAAAAPGAAAEMAAAEGAGAGAGVQAVPGALHYIVSAATGAVVPVPQLRARSDRLVPAETVRQLLGELYDARPNVVVEFVPYKDARHDKCFVAPSRARLAVPTDNAPAGAATTSTVTTAVSDLSDLPNLRAAPIYICIDMYDDGSCGAKAKAAIAEVVEHRGSGAAAAALGAGAAAADAASGAAGAQQGYGGGGAPPRQQSLTAALPALPPSLVSLSVSGHVPDDTGLLETLAGLTQLRRLYLPGMVLGSRGLRQLARLPHLDSITVDVLTLARAPVVVEGGLWGANDGAAGPGGSTASGLPTMPQLRYLAVHDAIIVRHRLSHILPRLEVLSLGDTCGGEQPTDPQRRRARSETNTAQRRAFLSSGALLGHRALRRLLLWDKVYPLRELAGCVSLQELVLHGQHGGRWSSELGAWVTAGHVRSLRLVDCRSACRLQGPGRMALLSCCAFSEASLCATSLTLQAGDAHTVQLLATTALCCPFVVWRLRRLRLVDQSAQVREATVTTIVQHLPYLEEISVRRCAGLGEGWAQGLAAAVGRPGLKVAYSGGEPQIR